MKRYLAVGIGRTVIGVLLHLNVIAGKDAGSCADYARPRFLSELSWAEGGTGTYHQSFVLSVFFVTVIMSPFLNPKSPG